MLRQVFRSLALMAIVSSIIGPSARATLEVEPTPIAGKISVAQIDRLLDLIGLDVLLEQTQSHAMAQLMNPSVSMDEEARELARAVLRGSFSPQKVRPIAVAVLRQRLDARYAEASLAFLESQAARMEINSGSLLRLASTTSHGVLGAALSPVGTVAHEPEALVERIVELGQIRTAMLETSLAVTLSMWKGANDRLPPWMRLSRDHLDALRRQEWERAELTLTSEVIPALRRFPVHELNACVEFLTSDAGRSLLPAVDEALIKSLSVASREAGAGIVDAFGALRQE